MDFEVVGTLKFFFITKLASLGSNNDCDMNIYWVSHQFMQIVFLDNLITNQVLWIHFLFFIICGRNMLVK